MFSILFWPLHLDLLPYSSLVLQSKVYICTMAKISQDEIGLLWNDMEDRNWQELKKLLENNVENLDETERQELLTAVVELSDEPFPESVTELFYVLTREANIGPQKIWINEL